MPRQVSQLLVIAKSNREWFVAKPIGRLGGPGLIPVSFVEIRDAVTGKAIDQNQAAAAPVPRVEEWKKITQNYEAASITLGSFDKPYTAPSAIGASPSSSVYSARSDRLALTDPALNWTTTATILTLTLIHTRMKAILDINLPTLLIILHATVQPSSRIPPLTRTFWRAINTGLLSMPA